MQRRTLLFSLLILTFLAAPLSAQLRDHSSSDKTGSSSKSGKKANHKDALKSFDDMIKDKVVVEGLFTFYQDTTDNSMLMLLKPDQLGVFYLCNMARAAAEGAFYDTGPLGRSFPFYFERVGKNVLMMEKNLRLRADSLSPMSRALDKAISDHLFATLAIKSKPKDSASGFLIDPHPAFVRDADFVGQRLGQQARLGVSFDAKNSYFQEIKSFPENSEIEVMLHFKSSRSLGGATMQSGHSFFHRYHFSLSSLPETDFVPRAADDRVGYFVTQFQDYTNLDTETPYVRYIDRWHLKKKHPDARISEPEEPIVFWIDNAVPPEYRDAIAEAIEFWNPSFEKIGFRNAVIAEQMPDSVDWDPLDVRYSVIRWMISPGRLYAIGPHRTNPFTGQIYDSDISVSSDVVRYWLNLTEEFVKPVSFDGRELGDEDPLEPESATDHRACNYAAEMAEETAFGLAYLLSATGTLADKDSLTREYLHAALVEMVAHEVGHALGMRHNFKASTIYTLEQIQDPEFTRQNSTSGTIMDYLPPNIAAKGQPQGEFFASVPGPFDDWRIEYGYGEFGDLTAEEEADRLTQIASRSGEPELVYATDYDMSSYQIDPLVERHDLGADPIAYCEHKLGLTQELWQNAIYDFEKPGVSYEKIRRVFQTGWRSFYETARYVPRFVGGLYHNKSHIGDPGGQIPFVPVPAAEQRRAVAFLADNMFAADAFDVPASLLNRLQPARNGDFIGTIYRSPMAYQWHQRVLRVQATVINRLYSGPTFGRLLNNLSRVDDGDEKYTLENMFTQVRRSIWGEIVGPQNVSSLRRQLQLYHLRRMIGLFLSSSSIYPSDALSLAARDLDILEKAARQAVAASTLNEMTRAHFTEVGRQIEAARQARRNYFAF